MLRLAPPKPLRKLVRRQTRGRGGKLVEKLMELLWSKPKPAPPKAGAGVA